MELGGILCRLVPMLRFVGHRALLPRDLARLAFFAPGPGVDPRDRLAAKCHAQVVAALRQLERRSARRSPLSLGLHGAEQERGLALPRVNGQRVLQLGLTFIEPPLVPFDHP